MAGKRTILMLLFLLGAVFFFRTPSFINASDEIRIEAKTIEYNLIYPGILPDHPLYFLKNIRDNVVYFLTRDYLKKARLNLDFSDKKAAMALLLSQKGKWKLAGSVLSEGEADFSKIPDLMNVSRKQGVAAPENLILTLKLSNEKHQEVIEQMLKDAPQGERKNFEAILKTNNNIQKSLSTL